MGPVIRFVVSAGLGLGPVSQHEGLEQKICWSYLKSVAARCAFLAFLRSDEVAMFSGLQRPEPGRGHDRATSKRANQRTNGMAREEGW